MKPNDPICALMNIAKPLSSPECLPPLWRDELSYLWREGTLKALQDFLAAETIGKVALAPSIDDWFEAINRTSPNNTKVVILGQDPYHGYGQAHGLSFSVRRGIKIPPSLANIFKELHSDLGISTPLHGDLSNWADQGVLLLNSILSVRLGEPLSHADQGWEILTDAILRLLSHSSAPRVFILWGSRAQKKIKFINAHNHLILCAPHPSPLSVYRGFWGSKPFSKANAFLCARGIDPIDWSLKP